LRLAYVAVLFFSDQLQAAVSLFDLSSSSRRKNRDDDIGHLRDPGHQCPHRLTRHFNDTGIANGA
jgi:hypothetical protein